MRGVHNSFTHTHTLQSALAGIANTPLVFLSSFDFSCLEFRMLLPLLEAANMEAWAVDIIGWGFTEAGIGAGSQEVLGPAERRAHLLAFWKQKVPQGTSRKLTNVAMVWGQRGGGMGGGNGGEFQGRRRQGWGEV